MNDTQMRQKGFNSNVAASGVRPSTPRHAQERVTQVKKWVQSGREQFTGYVKKTMPQTLWLGEDCLKSQSLTLAPTRCSLFYLWSGSCLSHVSIFSCGSLCRLPLLCSLLSSPLSLSFNLSVFISVLSDSVNTNNTHVHTDV